MDVPIKVKRYFIYSHPLRPRISESVSDDCLSFVVGRGQSHGRGVERKCSKIVRKRNTIENQTKMERDRDLRHHRDGHVSIHIRISKKNISNRMETISREVDSKCPSKRTSASGSKVERYWESS
jgi:hypothetical protein